MSSSRRRYNTPVAYYVSSSTAGVYISNKYTALLIYQIWLEQSIKMQLTTQLKIDALLPPTVWPAWSRKHIISLLNGCWHQSSIVKTSIVNGVVVNCKDYSRSKFNADNYELHANVIHKSMSSSESIALNNTIMFPQILKLILRAPSILAAKTALRLDKLSVFPDGSSSTKHLHVVWKFLRLLHEGSKK